MAEWGGWRLEIVDMDDCRIEKVMLASPFPPGAAEAIDGSSPG